MAEGQESVVECGRGEEGWCEEGCFGAVDYLGDGGGAGCGGAGGEGAVATCLTPNDQHPPARVPPPRVHLPLPPRQKVHVQLLPARPVVPRLYTPQNLNKGLDWPVAVP